MSSKKSFQQYRWISVIFNMQLVKYNLMLFFFLKTVSADIDNDDVVTGQGVIDPEQDGTTWKDGGFGGHGTTHEQVGQVHWPQPEYTPYTPHRNFSKDVLSPSFALYPVYNFSHILLKSILTEDPVLPPGEWHQHLDSFTF